MSESEALWRISSFSNSGGCVAVHLRPDGGAEVRDSKDPDGPVQKYSPREWQAFLLGVKAGEFDPAQGDK